VFRASKSPVTGRNRSGADFEIEAVSTSSGACRSKSGSGLRNWILTLPLVALNCIDAATDYEIATPLFNGFNS
jgi:hypothetical protein